MSTVGLEAHFDAIAKCRELRNQYLADRAELYTQLYLPLVREMIVEDAVEFLDEVPVHKLGATAAVTLISKLAEVATKQEKVMFAALVNAALD
jgi:hypothetical protein